MHWWKYHRSSMWISYGLFLIFYHLPSLSPRNLLLRWVLCFVASEALATCPAQDRYKLVLQVNLETRRLGHRGWWTNQLLSDSKAFLLPGFPSPCRGRPKRDESDAASTGRPRAVCGRGWSLASFSITCSKGLYMFQKAACETYRC